SVVISPRSSWRIGARPDPLSRPGLHHTDVTGPWALALIVGSITHHLLRTPAQTAMIHGPRRRERHARTPSHTQVRAIGSSQHTLSEHHERGFTPTPGPIDENPQAREDPGARSDGSDRSVGSACPGARGAQNLRLID